MQMKVTSKWWTSRVRGLFPGKTTPKKENPEVDEIALSSSGPQVMEREIREVRGPPDPCRSNDGKAVMVLLGSEIPGVSSRPGNQAGSSSERQGLFLETTFSETDVKRGGHVRHRQKSTSTVTPAKSVGERSVLSVPKATAPHSSTISNPVFSFQENASSTTADANVDPKGEARAKLQCTYTSQASKHYRENERGELFIGDTAASHVPRAEPLTLDLTANHTAKEKPLARDTKIAKTVTGDVHVDYSRHNGHVASGRAIEHGEVKVLDWQTPDINKTGVTDKYQPTTTRSEVPGRYANDYVVASNLSTANAFSMPVRDFEQTANHSKVNAALLTNKDPVRTSTQVTEDTRETSQYPTNGLARLSNGVTKDYEKVPNSPTKDLTGTSDCTTKDLWRIPNEPKTDLAKTSDCTQKDLGKITKDTAKDLERTSVCPAKELGRIPDDSMKDLANPSDCTSKESARSTKHPTKDFARNPKHATKDHAKCSKHSTKDVANTSRHASSTTPRLSSKDKEVRRLARNVVGSMETLMGDLHGIVGDLRQLVQQIDTVTDTIDHTCRQKGMRTLDGRCSPGKRHQQKRNGEAHAIVSSSHASGETRIKGTASLGRKRDGSVDGSELAAWNTPLHKLSYQQCSRWSPLPEGDSSDADTKKQRHSKSSKRTKDSRQASQKKNGKTEDFEKHLPRTTKCDYISESPNDSDSAFSGIKKRQSLHSPCNGANATPANGASNDLSKYFPGSPSSFTTGEFDPTFISVVSPDSEADWTKETDAAKGLDNLIPFSAYQDKTAAGTKDLESLSVSAGQTGNSSASPTNGLEIPMPDTSLKCWKEKMEWHCGSAESLTPQIDWSYLALTEHPVPGTALAGNFDPRQTDRMEPDSLLLHHHTMWSFASPQTSDPSNPHKTANASPVPPSIETSNKPCLVYAHNPSPEQPKSTPFLYTYNPNPEQPRRDPSKLALTGLRIKHELSRFSDNLKESNHGDQCSPASREPHSLGVPPQGEKPKGLLTLSDAPRSVVTDQASLRWKCSGALAQAQSSNTCVSPLQFPSADKKVSVENEKASADSAGVFPGKTDLQKEDGTKRKSIGIQVVDGVRLTRHNPTFFAKDRHRHGGGVYRSNAAVFSYVGRQCLNGFRVDASSTGAFRPPFLNWDFSGNGAAGGVPQQPEKPNILGCVSVDRNGEGDVFAHPELSLPAGNAAVERSGNGMCASGAVKPRSSSESSANPATGVVPHVKQGVGGAPLGWNTSTKALPDWPSGDLSSIDASDTDVDDLSSPFLPLHFQYPRRSSAADTSPERNSKHSNPRRSWLGSSTSDNCSQEDSPPPPPRHCRVRSDSKRVGEGRQGKVVPSSPGVCSSGDSSLHYQDVQLPCESSSPQKASTFQEPSATGANPELQTPEQLANEELVAGDTMSSGGFEVGQSVDVTPESDLVVPNDGHYECDMESRLEQLSSEVDESDFSDADADVGSDVLEQSLASLEISGSAVYDRDVSTWKSYTMTHIDSDDVVSECASDILNENFVEPAKANPGFDDVNLNFDDTNFPSMAY